MAADSIRDSFGTCDQLAVDDTDYQIRRLDRVDGSARLPFCLKVLLENLLRNEDGRLVTVERPRRWPPGTRPPSTAGKWHTRRREC